MAVRHDAAVVNDAVTTGSPRSADLAPAPRRSNSVAAREVSRPLIRESSDPSPMESVAQQPASNDAASSSVKGRKTPTRVDAPTDFQPPPSNAAPVEHRASMPAGSAKPTALADAPIRPTPGKPSSPEPSVPFYAQLMSTTDQKAAEALAAKLIDNGFTGAYVERGAGAKGDAYRVRIKFPSEVSARAAVDGLKPFSKEVWVTRQP